MSSISLTKIRNESQNSVKSAISESLDLIGYSFPNKAKSIVIKANLCYYWDYTTGQTTDPKFIAALIDLIREKTSNANIAIVESDASAMKCKYAFRFLGYEKLSQKYNVRLINLSEDKTDVSVVTCAGHPFRFRIPQTIQNADLKINLSKIKYTMEPIKITCALKNIYGCNPYPKKYKYHVCLGESIVAINKAMKFDLCLIDGDIVSGIQPRRIGLVMASQDPVAIDSAAAEIAGLNPKAIKYLQLAKKEGLGNTAFIPKGLPLRQFKSMYPRKTINKKLMTHAFTIVTRVGLGKRLGVA